MTEPNASSHPAASGATDKLAGLAAVRVRDH